MTNADRTALIRQIRLMFCEGCTPLQLIKYVYDCHEGAQRWQSFVTDCFQQAFSVTLLALPDRYESLLENRKIQDHLNLELLHEIVANRHLWASEDVKDEVANSWFGEFAATDVWSATERFDARIIPELATIWPQLENTTQQYVRLLVVNSRVNYERSLILSRLAERLQETDVESGQPRS